MDCQIAKRNIPAYLDDAVSEQDRLALRSHLRTCRYCAESCERQLQLRAAVHSLPKVEVPADLAIRLRVTASRERNLRIGLARSSWESFTFKFKNLMRPLAFPLAGGFVAALLLFAALVPTFTHPVVAAGADVPCIVFTQPSLESMGPISFGPGDAIVDLRIDQQGRIINYSIVESGGHEEDIQRSIENSLLFTRFVPARLAPNSCPDCGVPMSGTIRMVFRSSHIEVRG
jgi:hypothetical protein